jgi:hypothetical protein
MMRRSKDEGVLATDQGRPLVPGKFDGLANVLPGFFKGIALGDAAGQGRDEDGVAAWIGRFEMDFEEHQRRRPF